MPRGSFAVWNRKIHIYLGLYFLLFIWLFSISGFALNHTTWSVIRTEPVDVNSEIALTTPDAEDDFAAARDIMRQFDLTGEIYRINQLKEGPGLDFSVIRPHEFYFIRADYEAGKATMRTRKRGFWAGLAGYHTFASFPTNRKGLFRDWFFTKVWSVATDALAVGAIVMVLGGIYMWLLLKTKRRGGAMALVLGCLSCAFFVFGLRWLL